PPSFPTRRSSDLALHLAVEPALDRVADEHEPDQEEKRGGEERDRDERHHQAGAEVRSHDPPPALEDELGDVPPDQEDEEDEEDQVDVDQADQDRVGAERAAAEGLREPELRNRQQGDGDDDAGDDPPLTPAAAHLGRRRPGGRRIGRAGHWSRRMVTTEGPEGKAGAPQLSWRKSVQNTSAGDQGAGQRRQKRLTPMSRTISRRTQG